MGNFYVNHTVRAEQGRVVELLNASKRTAFVSTTTSGPTVVFDKQCDDQDEAAIVELGRLLSAQLASPVLAVLNHDDDVFAYWLFENDTLLESYNSDPDYFNDDGDQDPTVSVEDAAHLVEDIAASAFRGTGMGSSVSDIFTHVRKIMEARRGGSDEREDADEDHDDPADESLGGQLCRAFGREEAHAEVRKILASRKYVFALDRHEDLVRALGLPEMAVGGGYSYIDDREVLEDSGPNGVIHVGSR